MASMTMTASFLGGSAVTHGVPTPRRNLIVAKASRAVEAEKASVSVSVSEEEKVKGRRDLVFAAAAAIAATFAGVAMADDEPKRGTIDAKKKYAPVCVTMPTAKICHK